MAGSVKLVAFTGRMSSGKSTAVNFFNKKLTEKLIDSTLTKFAQPLYDIQEYIYKRIESVYQRPQDFVKDRKLLQWIGTDWGRETVNENIWVDIWKKEVELFIASNVIVLCDDCRFDNEAQAIKSLGGIIIHIIRPGTDLDGKKTVKEHSSENGISDEYIDHVIVNSGTEEEYIEKLEMLFNELFSDIKTPSKTEIKIGDKESSFTRNFLEGLYTVKVKKDKRKKVAMITIKRGSIPKYQWSQIPKAIEQLNKAENSEILVYLSSSDIEINLSFLLDDGVDLTDLESWMEDLESMIDDK